MNLPIYYKICLICISNHYFRISPVLFFRCSHENPLGYAFICVRIFDMSEIKKAETENLDFKLFSDINLEWQDICTLPHAFVFKCAADLTDLLPAGLRFMRKPPCIHCFTAVSRSVFILPVRPI